MALRLAAVAFTARHSNNLVNDQQLSVLWEGGETHFPANIIIIPLEECLHRLIFNKQSTQLTFMKQIPLKNNILIAFIDLSWYL